MHTKFSYINTESAFGVAGTYERSPRFSWIAYYDRRGRRHEMWNRVMWGRGPMGPSRAQRSRVTMRTRLSGVSAARGRLATSSLTATRRWPPLSCWADRLRLPLLQCIDRSYTKTQYTKTMEYSKREQQSQNPFWLNSTYIGTNFRIIIGT